MKSLSRIIEEYGGYIGFIFFTIIFMFISPDRYHYYISLISGFPAIGLGVFGFMLTFIAIILQSDTETIRFMKRKKDIFRSFVSYNQRVVIVSAVLTIYSYLLSSFNFSFEFTLYGVSIYQIAKVMALSLFWGLFAKMCIDSYFFVRIFYVLLRK